MAYLSIETSAENRPSQINPLLRLEMNPSYNGYPSHFQYGRAFPSEIMI